MKCHRCLLFWKTGCIVSAASIFYLCSPCFHFPRVVHRCYKTIELVWRHLQNNLLHLNKGHCFLEMGCISTLDAKLELPCPVTILCAVENPTFSQLRKFLARFWSVAPSSATSWSLSSVYASSKVATPSASYAAIPNSFALITIFWSAPSENVPLSKPKRITVFNPLKLRERQRFNKNLHLVNQLFCMLGLQNWDFGFLFFFLNSKMASECSGSFETVSIVSSASTGFFLKASLNWLL